MRIERREGKTERRILTGMIVDQQVLGKIAPKWEGGLFRSRWANVVGQWCVDYHLKYRKAPGASVAGMFESWSQENGDEETIKLVERFLASLSDDWEGAAKESNSDYVVDQAAEYFNSIRVAKTIEAAQGDLDSGRPAQAVKRLQTFGRIEMGAGSAVDVLNNSEIWQQAFDKPREPIVTYPGALGQFFGDIFSRDSFVFFMAGEKRKKSFWLLDLAYQAVRQRRKVAYFEAGDMSQHQVLHRLASRITRRPLQACTIKYPKSITHAEGDTHATVTYEERKFDRGLDWRRTWEEVRKFARRRTKSKKPYFKMSCHPNSTLSANNIQTIIQGWQQENNWVPDVVIIDYADILAKGPGGPEGRDAINDTWKHLRRISQMFHCCVVTASQADADSYDAYVLTRRNFSEDKRKYSHITGVITINETEDEVEEGVQRLTKLMARSERESHRQLYVANCFDLAMPAVRSCW